MPALLAGLAALLLAGGLFWWFAWRQPTPQPAPVASLPADTAAPAPGVTPVSPTMPAPPPLAVIEPPATAASGAPAGPIAADGVGDALTALLGRKAVLGFFQLDDFARRFVATVDNLGRGFAPPMAWPVDPTQGRFLVRTAAEGRVLINPDNAQRYVPLLLLAESVPPAQWADLYVRLYPLLQRAYEDIGFPGAYFNDRLLAVIDLLLATPDAPESIAVVLTDVKGPITSQRPWVRYEFVDPAFEDLAAGQKILLRSGAVNERRVKALLGAFRAELGHRLKAR